MRVLIFLVFFTFSSFSFAMSLEDSFFVGIYSSGKHLNIDVRQNYDGGTLPYGSLEVPEFRYCEQVESIFQCSKSPKEKPSVIYRSGNYQIDNDDPTKGTGTRYKEAMSYLKKVMATFKGKVQFNGYYICEKGCDNTKPLYIFDFSRWFEEP